MAEGIGTACLIRKATTLWQLLTAIANRLQRGARAERAIALDETRVGHIFRDAPGHFPVDNSANRRVLLAVANDRGNWLGVDKFGILWAACVIPDGTQIWVQIRGGRITNGGVNRAARRFDPSAGLIVRSAREPDDEQ